MKIHPRCRFCNRKCHPKGLYAHQSHCKKRPFEPQYNAQQVQAQVNNERENIITRQKYQFNQATIELMKSIATITDAAAHVLSDARLQEIR